MRASLQVIVGKNIDASPAAIGSWTVFCYTRIGNRARSGMPWKTQLPETSSTQKTETDIFLVFLQLRK
jgi:hypothetical protein